MVKDDLNDENLDGEDGDSNDDTDEDENGAGGGGMMDMIMVPLRKMWEKAGNSWEGLEKQLDSMKEGVMGKMMNSPVMDKIRDAIRTFKEKGEEFPDTFEDLVDKIKKQFK